MALILVPVLFILAFASSLQKVSADQPHFGQADYDEYNAGRYGNRPNQSYHTVDFKSPAFLINSWRRDAVSPESHIFMGLEVDGQAHSPFIFSAKDLSLVYADPSWYGRELIGLQDYQGKKYMTIWSGEHKLGWGTGHVLLLDGKYQVFKNMTTTDDLDTGANVHEFQLTHDGGALFSIYTDRNFIIKTTEGPVGGRLQGGAFQEIDLETGKARFTWVASDNIDLGESVNRDTVIASAKGEAGWDWVHQNSVEKTSDGNYLVSEPHLSAVMLINGTDGGRIWQLGGKRNDFRDLSGGRATGFSRQHHARFVDGSMRELTLFTNDASYAGGNSKIVGCEKWCSRALRIALDYDVMTARVVQEWYHLKSAQAWTQGGVQALPAGGAMIAWGSVPSFTEVAADGEIVMEVQLSPWFTNQVGQHDGVSMSRVYKSDFKAYPPWDPAVACVNGTLYVSWNGATEVDSWSVVSLPSSIFSHTACPAFPFRPARAYR